jgi:hypothetical protein
MIIKHLLCVLKFIRIRRTSIPSFYAFQIVAVIIEWWHNDMINKEFFFNLGTWIKIPN